MTIFLIWLTGAFVFGIIIAIKQLDWNHDKAGLALLSALWPVIVPISLALIAHTRIKLWRAK